MADFSAGDSESLKVFKLLFDFGEKKSWWKSLSVSFFWSEKLTLLIQFLQLFALCYAVNYDYWTEEWRGIIDWVTVVNLDLSSLLHDIIVEDSSGRTVYLAIWVFVCMGMIALYIVGRFFFICSVVAKVKFYRHYFKIAHLLYLPIALGLLPYSICRYDGCWEFEFWQTLFSMLGYIAAGTFLVGMPIYLLLHAKKQILTPDPEDHEQFIQLREMEMVLQISHSWLTEKIYLISSFKLDKLRIYHRPLYQLFVLSMVTVHSVFVEDFGLKMLILTIQITAFSVYVTIFPVYRCFSSSMLLMELSWVLTANYFVAYLKVVDYDSQTLVGSNFTALLAVINLCGLLLLFFLFALFLAFKLKWPVNSDTVKKLALGFRFLLTDLRSAQRMILILRSTTNYQFVKLEPIEKMIDILQNHYELLYQENHPLQYTVLEQVDILDFLRKKVASATLLPCERLERDYPLLLKVVNRRYREQILMNPLKRRILLKLNLLKMFIGNRRTLPFNTGEETNFVGLGEGKRRLGLSDFENFKPTSKEESFQQELPASEDEQILPAVEENSLILQIERAVQDQNHEDLNLLTERALLSPNSHIKNNLVSAWRQVGESKLREDLKRALLQ